MTIDPNICLEACTYLQPLINSCSGFIKTEGYFAHDPGVISMFSADETFFSCIQIPVCFDISFVSNINKFLSNKTEDEMKNIFSNIYFLGENLVKDRLDTYRMLYTSLEVTKTPLFIADDYTMIPGFEEAVNSVEVTNLAVTMPNIKFVIPVSKAITPINKGDTCSVSIYEDAYNRLGSYTVKYSIFKKKFKVFVNIYFNVLSLC